MKRRIHRKKFRDMKDKMRKDNWSSCRKGQERAETMREDSE